MLAGRGGGGGEVLSCIYSTGIFHSEVCHYKQARLYWKMKSVQGGVPNKHMHEKITIGGKAFV